MMILLVVKVLSSRLHHLCFRFRLQLLGGGGRPLHAHLDPFVSQHFLHALQLRCSLPKFLQVLERLGFRSKGTESIA